MEQEKDVNMKNNKQIPEPSPHIFKSFKILFGAGVVYAAISIFVVGYYDQTTGPLVEFILFICIIAIFAFIESFWLHVAYSAWALAFKHFSETLVFHSLVILILLNAGVATVTAIFDFFELKSLLLFPLVAPFIASLIAGLTSYRKK